MAIKPLTTDFSIIDSIGFDLPPVGVKFEFFKPEGYEPLDIQLAMCEMPREAQKRGTAFYMTKDNENCMGKGAMGMMDEPGPSWAGAGLIGERMGIFRDAGTNMRCMTHYTVFGPKSVNYVLFAPLPVLDFEPDMLIFTGDITQSGTILRAMSYGTGEPFESKATAVFQCAWMFPYPYLQNKVNYITLGTGHGTTARETYERGEVMVSVPAPYFPIILDSLKEMDIVPEAWAMGREKWLEVEEGIYGKIISDTAEAGLL